MNPDWFCYGVFYALGGLFWLTCCCTYFFSWAICCCYVGCGSCFWRPSFELWLLRSSVGLSPTVRVFVLFLCCYCCCNTELWTGSGFCCGTAALRVGFDATTCCYCYFCCTCWECCLTSSSFLLRVFIDSMTLSTKSSFLGCRLYTEVETTLVCI